MRKFLDARRLWGTPGGPEEGWVKPHVLWLPQDQPEVMTYFGRLREVIDQFGDIVTPVNDDDVHLTLQKIDPITAAGERVDAAHLATAATTVQQALADLDPFTVEVGPARTSRSAATVDLWPEHDLNDLYHRVRRGLKAAGLTLPESDPYLWCHISIGYGAQDTDTPELARRSDELASAVGNKGIRPGIRAHANVSTVWLVWERQDPVHNRYTFRRAHELHLGSSKSRGVVPPLPA